jgi:hypothetical protein
VFGINVGDVVLIVVSALGGAWANGRRRDREMEKAENRELKGLLLLINSEVRYNTTLLMTAMDNTAARHVKNLRTDTWDNAMDRMAQLLPPEDTSELSQYYGHVRLLRMRPPPEGQKPPLDKWGNIEFVMRNDAQVVRIAMKHKAITGNPPPIHSLTTPRTGGPGKHDHLG